MKIIYIAHPISGNVKENLASIAKIARQINLTNPDVTPIAPYFLDCYALNDAVPEERERGIQNDITILKSGIVKELWLYGNRISAGMFHEIELAHDLKIRVVPMTQDTKTAYTKLLTTKC